MSYLFHEEFLITWASKKAFEKEKINHWNMKETEDSGFYDFSDFAKDLENHMDFLFWFTAPVE